MASWYMMETVYGVKASLWTTHWFWRILFRNKIQSKFAAYPATYWLICDSFLSAIKKNSYFSRAYVIFYENKIENSNVYRLHNAHDGRKVTIGTYSTIGYFLSAVERDKGVHSLPLEIDPRSNWLQLANKRSDLYEIRWKLRTSVDPEEISNFFKIAASFKLLFYEFHRVKKTSKPSGEF